MHLIYTTATDWSYESTEEIKSIFGLASASISSPNKLLRTMVAAA